MDILTALKLCNPALSSGDFIPILTHFCFDEDRVFAYDDSTAVVVNKDYGVVGGVRGKVLLDLLSGIEGKEYSLSSAEESLVFKAGVIEASLPTLSKDDFLFSMPEDLPSEEIMVSSDFFSRLEWAAGVSSVTAFLPQEKGVTFDVGGGSICLFSNENRTTISKSMCSTSTKKRKRVRTVLSRPSCECLSKVLKQSGASQALLYVNESWAVVEMEVEEVLVQVICHSVPVTDFVEYESLIKKAEGDDSLCYSDIPEDFFSLLATSVCVMGGSEDAQLKIKMEKKGKTKKQEKWTLLAEGIHGKAKSDVTFDAGCSALDEFYVDPYKLLKVKDVASKIKFSSEAICVESSTSDIYQAIAYYK